MSPRPLLDPSPSPSPSPPPLLPPPPSPVTSLPTVSMEDEVAGWQWPSDDEEWVQCLVQPNDIEPVDASWANLQHLPQFHVVGKTKEGYMVAVAVSILPLLDDLDIRYAHADGAFSGDWRPRREVSSDRQWFVQNAMAGIATRARGLAELYRGMFRYWSTVSSDLRLPIEWAILLRDIKNAPPNVLETFFHSCSLLDSLLHDATHPRPTPMHVMERLYRASTELAMVSLPVEEITTQMHQISLLRGLLEYAGGRRDARQHTINKRRSVNDNLRYLCALLCSDQTSGPLPSRGPRAVDDHRLDHIAWFAPFRFENAVYTILPADLIDNLPYNTVEATLLMYHLPACEPPEALCLFLCRYTSVERNYGGLSAWMASAEGRSKRDEIVQLLHGAQTRYQTWVYLGALMCFERVLGSSDGAAIGGGFFGQFGHDKTQTVWHYVANCLHQIDRCDLDAVSFLVDEEWRPVQLMDRALVLYWHLRDFVAHDQACKTLSHVFSGDETHEADV